MVKGNGRASGNSLMHICRGRPALHALAFPPFPPSPPSLPTPRSHVPKRILLLALPLLLLLLLLLVLLVPEEGVAFLLGAVDAEVAWPPSPHPSAVHAEEHVEDLLGRHVRVPEGVCLPPAGPWPLVVPELVV